MVKNFVKDKKGELEETLSDNKLLSNLTGYTPNTPIKEGLRKFVVWYKEFYNI